MTMTNDVLMTMTMKCYQTLAWKPCDFRETSIKGQSSAFCKVFPRPIKLLPSSRHIGQCGIMSVHLLSQLHCYSVPPPKIVMHFGTQPCVAEEIRTWTKFVKPTGSVSLKEEFEATSFKWFLIRTHWTAFLASLKRSCRIRRTCTRVVLCVKFS